MWTIKVLLLCAVCYNFVAVIAIYPRFMKLFVIGASVLLAVMPVSFTSAAGSGAKVSTAPVSKTAKTFLGIQLAFEKMGTVSKVYVHTNDTVHKGQPLVELDASEARALLHQSEADLALEKIKFDQMQGTPESGSATSDSIRLNNARDALENTKQSVIDVLEDGYTKAEDAVRNRTDQFFSNVKTMYPQVILLGVDANSRSILSAKHITMESLFVSWKSFLDGLTAASDLSAAMDTHIANLLQVRDFLDSASVMLNAVNSDPNVSALTLRSWKTDVYTGRANVNTALKDTIAIKMKLREAQTQVALQEVNKGKNASLLQQARVEQAQAKKELLQVALNKMTLLAPADGAITKVLVSPGSVVKAINPVVYFKFARAVLIAPVTTP